jgi:branched-chain amino acid transport system ATP-binding protein
MSRAAGAVAAVAPRKKSEPLLAVDAIEVAYDRVISVLEGVSLQVPDGAIVALLGPNGAGKTTTLKAISNLLRAERGAITKGAIRFRGERIDRLSAAAVVHRGVIQVMEGRRCFPHLTTHENLLTGAVTRRDGKAHVRRDLERVYTHFPQLDERRRTRAGYLSGGEQQMLAIGRALMSRPSLILLDEPSMGLAPQVVSRILATVRHLNEVEGTTVLLAEQNANMALGLADYGYVLQNGCVSLEGTAAELRNNPAVQTSYLGV